MNPLEPRFWGNMAAICLDLHQTGFSVIKGYDSNVDIPLASSLMDDWWQWFVAGGDDRYLFDPETQAGWFPVEKSEKAKGRTEVDLKEYYHYFPHAGAPPHLEEKTRKHFDQMLRFSNELLGWLGSFVSANVDDDVPDLVELSEGSPYNLLRVLYYPPIPSGVEDLDRLPITRAAEHTDINMLTFITAPTTKGLQVFSEEHGWMDVPVDEDHIIVNVGDALDLATRGFLKSARHRVVIPDGDERFKSRVSMPFFLHARPDAILSGEITAQEHLRKRLRELGVAS
ncbi:MAG: isopenicillin N synthase family oxygenase [Gammaproteobacteria bacterium AqS3]|nr:isopenicillin N synthase family oxygenase [Gammaproteobacteria bacterium AqS3]